jgi:hypothetical protein
MKNGIEKKKSLVCDKHEKSEIETEKQRKRERHNKKKLFDH